MFSTKCLLITGGTGSFGNAVLKRFLNTDIAEIRIFSRDEKKQDDMRKRYNHPKLKFYIGDVRDSRSIAGAMRGVNYVFHAAALKQVPSCEFHPMQAVRTNVLGTENVLEAAIEAGVQRVGELMSLTPTLPRGGTVTVVSQIGNLTLDRDAQVSAQAMAVPTACCVERCAPGTCQRSITGSARHSPPSKHHSPTRCSTSSARTPPRASTPCSTSGALTSAASPKVRVTRREGPR